jgi:4-carboxymuconolactone decarboxylase
MSRINTLTNEEMSPRQRETYQRIAKGPRKGVNGPFAVWLRTPEFADRAEALGNYCRFESTLFQRAIELTILLVARHWQASFA